MLVPGLSQQLSGSFRIVGIRFYIARIRPIVWRQQAGCRAGLIAPKVLDDAFTIDAVSEGLPHADVTKDRICQIERDVLVIRAGRLSDIELLVAPKHLHHIRRQGIQREIDAAFLQFQGDDDFFRDYLEPKHRHAGLLTKVGIVAFEDDLLVLDVSDELEWPRPDRMAIEVRRGAFW